jgi:hypothetical protein
MPTLMNTQHVPFTLTITNTAGQPATVQPGSIVWATSDPTIITVAPAADGLSGFIEAVGPNTATATVSVTADADLGAGIVTITGVSDPADPFTVTQDPAQQASTFTMTFAPPVAKA